MVAANIWVKKRAVSKDVLRFPASFSNLLKALTNEEEEEGGGRKSLTFVKERRRSAKASELMVGDCD